MSIIRVASIAILISFAAASSGQDVSSQLIAAQGKYRSGDLEGALQGLEPLLKSDDLGQPAKQRVIELAARVLHRRGEERFRQAEILKSIADFDRQIELQPDDAPGHWQRGIALYYDEEYEKGSQQFKLHQTVNPQDVENAVWHFLCIVRAPNGSLKEARKSFIPVTKDPRVPMAQIHQLFAGVMTPEEVLQVGEKEDDTACFYANLYVGLYYEVLNQAEESLQHLRLAAENPKANGNYMGHVARVHVTLRKKASSLTRPQISK